MSDLLPQKKKKINWSIKTQCYSVRVVKFSSSVIKGVLTVAHITPSDMISRLAQKIYRLKTRMSSSFPLFNDMPSIFLDN